jgi:hypothetical protein
MRRLRHSALALLALAAIVLASPIGSGGTAAAAEGGAGESRLEREIDRLSNGERAEVERQIADRLAEAGVDLEDPRVDARLAGVLGVSTDEIKRAAEVWGPTDPANPAISAPILLIFIAAALIFLPGFLKLVGDTMFGQDSAGGVGGVEALR